MAKKKKPPFLNNYSKPDDEQRYQWAPIDDSNREQYAALFALFVELFTDENVADRIRRGAVKSSGDPMKLMALMFGEAIDLAEPTAFGYRLTEDGVNVISEYFAMLEG